MPACSQAIPAAHITSVSSSDDDKVASRRFDRQPLAIGFETGLRPG